MGKIVVTEFVTADGVVGEPQEWSFPYWNDAIAEFKNDEHMNAEATLLGRVTYEAFAEAWPSRDGEFADRLNAMPKYVVSRALKAADWNNTKILRSIDEIAKLRDSTKGHLLVHGSPTLLKSLVDAGLVDEYRLLVYPLVLGGGKRLFREGEQAKLALADVRDMGSGVVAMCYTAAPADA